MQRPILITVAKLLALTSVTLTIGCATKPTPGCPGWLGTLQGPGFPKAAARAGIEQGTATVRFTLNPNGSIAAPAVVASSNSLFNEELLQRTSKLKCVGDKQPVLVQFSVNFRVE